MFQKSLLLEREFNTSDYDVRQNWYAAREILNAYKSVQSVRFTETCSSAGDWGGYFVQKIGKRSYVILFNQENNYPRSGFTVWTARIPTLSYVGDMPEDEITQAIYGEG